MGVGYILGAAAPKLARMPARLHPALERRKLEPVLAHAREALDAHVALRPAGIEPKMAAVSSALAACGEQMPGGGVGASGRLLGCAACLLERAQGLHRLRVQTTGDRRSEAVERESILGCLDELTRLRQRRGEASIDEFGPGPRV